MPQAPAELRPLLKPSEIGRLLNCSRQKVYDLIAAGELPPIRVGAAIRIHPDDLDEYLRRNRLGN